MSDSTPLVSGCPEYHIRVESISLRVPDIDTASYPDSEHVHCFCTAPLQPSGSDTNYFTIPGSLLCHVYLRESGTHNHFPN